MSLAVRGSLGLCSWACLALSAAFSVGLGMWFLFSALYGAVSSGCLGAAIAACGLSVYADCCSCSFLRWPVWVVALSVLLALVIRFHLSRADMSSVHWLGSARLGRCCGGRWCALLLLAFLWSFFSALLCPGFFLLAALVVLWGCIFLRLLG